MEVECVGDMKERKEGVRGVLEKIMECLVGNKIPIPVEMI